MDIYIYSDESGVFDQIHNEYFVYGGVIFLSKNRRDICSRKYINAEKTVRQIEHIDREIEVKAASIKNSSKGKLYRSLNDEHKFGGVIYQPEVLSNIFNNKKSKQRYLDYVFKIAVRRKFEDLIHSGEINPSEVESLFFFIDEHTTATDGRYELKEALENEFKIGTFNNNFSSFHPPIFKNLKQIKVKYCNSSSVTLVRAADIVANKLFYFSKQGRIHDMRSHKNVITEFPHSK